MGNRDKKGTLLRRKRGSWFVALAPFMIRQGMKLFRVSPVYFLLLFIDYSRGQFWNWLRYLADKKLFSNFSEIASRELLQRLQLDTMESLIFVYFIFLSIFHYVNVFTLNFISNTIILYQFYIGTCWEGKARSINCKGWNKTKDISKIRKIVRKLMKLM